MPQTIGSRYEAKLRAQERLKPFSEADDFRLLNEAIERNTKSDPNIEANRQLTREDKEWTSRALDIDTQAAQFAEFILEGDTKDKTIRDDLTIKEINHAKKALPGLIESLRAMNPEGDPRTTNYINAMNMKFSTALQTAEKSAFLKDSLGNVQELIEDLGDDERLEGKWNLKDTQFFIDNVKTLSKSYLDASGEDVDDHFQPLIQMHDDKRAVFSALAHFTKPGSQANANVKASPKALANLNAAVRLMRTSQNENIEEVKGLLDKIPEFLGQSGETRRTEGITSDKEEKEDVDKIYDASIRQKINEIKRFKDNDDVLDSTYQDWDNYTFGLENTGSYALPGISEEAREVTTTVLMTQLRGVDGFNKNTLRDEGYASDYDIDEEVKKGNRARVLEYFLDTSPLKAEDKHRRQGITTVGELRVFMIKSGGKDTIKQKTAMGKISNMLGLIDNIDKRVGKKTNRKLKNPKQMQKEELEAMRIEFPEMFDDIQGKK
jgi:hypothetical protein